MTMKIYDKLNGMLGHYFLNLIFHVENLWMLRFLLSLPIAIQIVTHCVATIVS